MVAKQLAVCAVFLSTKILLEPLLTHINSLLPPLSTAILFFFFLLGVELDLFYSSFSDVPLPT